MINIGTAIIEIYRQEEEKHPYYIHFRKAKNPDDYFRKHESNLNLYDRAKKILRRSGYLGMEQNS